MIGWLLGGIAIGCLLDSITGDSSQESVRRCEKLEQENNRLRKENYYIRVQFSNHMTLLADYDVVNSYAKQIGFKGCIDFFYYLSKFHDQRFEHFAKFLNKIRHIRVDVAHHGVVYDIKRDVIEKLKLCVQICDRFNNLSYGDRLSLGYRG